MKESGEMTCEKDLESRSSLKVTFSKESGSKIRCMERAYWCMQMAQSMKDSGIRDKRWKVTESSSMLTVTLQ